MFEKKYASSVHVYLVGVTVFISMLTIQIISLFMYFAAAPLSRDVLIWQIVFTLVPILFTALFAYGLRAQLSADELKSYSDELLACEPLRPKYLKLLKEHLNNANSLSLYAAWRLMRRMRREERPIKRQSERDRLAQTRNDILSKK